MLNGTYCSAGIILDAHGAHRFDDTVCRKGRPDLGLSHLAPSSTCVVGRRTTAHHMMASMATEESSFGEDRLYRGQSCSFCTAGEKARKNTTSAPDAVSPNHSTARTQYNTNCQ